MARLNRILQKTAGNVVRGMNRSMMPVNTARPRLPYPNPSGGVESRYPYPNLNTGSARSTGSSSGQPSSLSDSYYSRRGRLGDVTAQLQSGQSNLIGDALH